MFSEILTDEIWEVNISSIFLFWESVLTKTDLDGTTNILTYKYYTKTCSRSPFLRMTKYESKYPDKKRGSTLLSF